MASEAEHEAPPPRDPRGRVVAGRAAPVGQRRTSRRAARHPGDRLPDRRRKTQRRDLPALHHHHRPERGIRGCSRRRLRAAGRSSPPSTSSRSTSEDLAPCCARSHPTSYFRRSGVTCAATSRSGPSCGKPPTTPTSTRTGSASSPLCASLAAPSQRRAIFPPQGSDHGWRHAIMLLCRRLNPARRQRSNPRLVKRKYVKWHVKRAHHRDWPQPTGPPVVTITGSN